MGTTERVLVTGGFGFIGSRLVLRLLESGRDVTIIDSLLPQIHGDLPVVRFLWQNQCRIIRADMRDFGALDRALEEVDAVAHLAAETGTGQSMYEIARYSDVNVGATALLLDRIVNRRLPIKRFVLASSRAIYGEGSYVCARCGPNRIFTPPSRLATDLAGGLWEPICRTCGSELSAVATVEAAPPAPASIYAATKMVQEDLVRIACTSIGIPAIALRFQNVYGEGQSLNNPYTGIISIFSTRIRRGLSLPLYEDGAESRDFVHVVDVVTALAGALLNPFEGYAVVNIGTGAQTSVRALAMHLIDALGGTQVPEVTGAYRLGDIRHCFADLTAAREVMGFVPQIDIAEGLARFAAWVVNEPLPEDGLERAVAELQAHGLMAEATA
jgi:dTDP-L-rhamnose 4-epimerase